MAEDVSLADFVQVLAAEPANGGMLQNARVKDIGGRQFIVGELITMQKGDATRDPREGLTFWFPIDQVYMLTQYPDYESARRAQLEWAKKDRDDR
jgi:hypothetical protein